MVYINKGDHDNPYGLPKDNLGGSQDIVHHDYAHIDIPTKMPKETKNWNTHTNIFKIIKRYMNLIHR